MHSYSVYGLCIASEIPLAGLSEGEGVPDVVITVRSLSREDLDSSPGRLGGVLDGVLPVVIEGGTRVSLDPPTSLPLGDLVGYVTGIIFSAVLRQRGLLVLHASAAERDGQAVAFLGHSGWGKSTLAEAFLQRGYTVLTDDILALDMEGGVVRVKPGPPYIRLRSGAGEALLPDSYASLPMVDARGDQRLRVLPSRLPSAPQLRGVFMLGPEDAARNAVIPLPSQEALVSLLPHSWGKHLFTMPEAQAEHLRLCAQLVRRVPIKRLQRVRALASLPDHIALVEEDAGIGEGAATFLPAGN